MDVRSRYYDENEVLSSLADAVQARIWTAIPVKVTKDSDGNTVSLQPLIKATRRRPDGTQEQVDLPTMGDCPVQFSGGGGVTVTHPIKENDEGVALISSRSLDGWHQQGGSQPQIDARMHDLSDAIYIPGIRSTPRKIEKYNKDTVEMRSDDGKHRMSMHPTDGMTVSIDEGKHTMSFSPKGGVSMASTLGVAMKAGKGFKLTGDFDVDGKVKSTKGIDAPTLKGSIITGMLIGLGLAGALYAATLPALEARVAARVEARLVVALATQGPQLWVASAGVAP